MTVDLSNIPSDLALLQKLVTDLFSDLKEKEGLIEKLRHQLACFQRHQFGRRSEKLDPKVQLLFSFLESLDPSAAEALLAPQEEEKKKDETKKKGHGRKKLPGHLPRERVEHGLPEESRTCKGCGRGLTRIRDEVSEQLEYKPASFYVKRHVRGVYACKECQENVVTAPFPDSKPIEKGIPGPGLLAHVLTSKYCDHTPLNRLERIFRRSGVEIPRSTMCGWVGSSTDLLRPIYSGLKERMLQSGKIHTDETTMPVLDRNREKTRKASFWTFIGDDDHPYTVYEYAPTKTSETPKNVLGDYEGYLQADAHTGYDALYTSGDIQEVGCNAHARRKFFDAKGTDPPRAMIALSYFRLLYDVEREARDLSPDERKALRAERSRPVLKRFKKWLDRESLAVLPKSPIGQAVAYTRSNCEALTRYLDSGALEIDNNAAERALRPVVIGRKNYMFAGSDAGGERAAVIYSLVETCRRHNIDPFVYLRDVLERVSTERASNIHRLFPDQWCPRDESVAGSR